MSQLSTRLREDARWSRPATPVPDWLADWVEANAVLMAEDRALFAPDFRAALARINELGLTARRERGFERWPHG